MSIPEGIVQAQMEALLRRVAREQEMLSRRSRDAAEEQSRGIVARAREEARARTGKAAEEARLSVERALTDRRAALETAARQREQTLLRELMDSAWAALPGALAASWQDADRRGEWCETACALARRIVMGDGPFTIEIDAAAPPELNESLRRCMPDPGTPPAIRAVEGLGAGLRIRRGLACVDATVPGLLASRERVEAELLAELDALLQERRRVPT